MGFGSGSGDDPFDEDDSEETQEPTESESTQPQEQSTPAREDTDMDGSTSTGQTAVQQEDNAPAESGHGVPAFSDIEVTEQHSTQELARMLMAEEFHDEDPRVPYATWRSGTSTGRDRTTIELNEDVDDLVKSAMREFEDQYDAEINKADIREFALVVGLMHTEDLFAMAEEWGLQFNG